MPPSSTVTEGIMRWCRYAKETVAWPMKRRAASHAAIFHRDGGHHEMVPLR